MPDMENVIKGLECCLDYFETRCEKCPYKATDEDRKHIDWDCHKDVLQRDAIALLKEQEAVTVESIQMDRSDKWGADLTGYCPSCKRPLKSRFNQRFCGECGQAVKWE